MENVGQKVNTNQSMLGQDIIDWIKSDKSTKTEQEQVISRKLYHKYIVDRDGNPKEICQSKLPGEFRISRRSLTVYSFWQQESGNFMEFPVSMA